MTFTGTEESRGGAGGRLPLTHFLFLLVQLVGCTPHLSCGGGFGTTTSQFLSFFIILFLFFYCFCLTLNSRAPQTVQSHWGERQLHATLTPVHRGCWWEPVTAPLFFDQSRHERALCSSGFIPVTMSLESLCTSSLYRCVFAIFLAFCIFS